MKRKLLAIFTLIVCSLGILAPTVSAFSNEDLKSDTISSTNFSESIESEDINAEEESTAPSVSSENTGDVTSESQSINEESEVNNNAESSRDEEEKEENEVSSFSDEVISETVLPSIEYATKVEGQGWQDKVEGGETAGTTGKGIAITAFKVGLTPSSYTGGIEYQSHFANVGWQGYVEKNEISGDHQFNLPLQAVQLRLTGELATHFDIYYRVHVTDIGWLDWASNDEVAGTIGFNLGLQSIEIQLLPKGQSITGRKDQSSIEFKNTQVSYTAHVSNLGWQNAISNGQTAGTTGRNLQMEALKLDLNNNNATGDIQYRAHVKNLGWLSYQSLGGMAGTVGKKLHMEAIQIRLTGQLSLLYDIYYRVHVANFGWLDWGKNNDQVGTTGFNFQMEAIQIKLVRKSQPAINTAGRKFVNYSVPTINYAAHISNLGWLGNVTNSQTAGTTGRKLQMEALKMSLSGSGFSGGIQYRAHVENIGWQNYVNAGSITGTVGWKCQIEAVQIKLTGEYEKYFDIYYRTHVENFGWRGWAKNGESAGSQKYNYQMEALQVTIVKKGAAAPGTTTNPFSVKPDIFVPKPSPNAWKTATGGVQPLLVGRTGLRVEVNLAKQLVYIYDSKGLIYTMLCSSGTAATPTIKGNFRIQSRGPQFMGSLGGARYYVQFYGNYLFHSVIINNRGEYIISEAEKLGTPRSHGCIRLAVPDAIWFYNQLPTGTPVRIY